MKSYAVSLSFCLCMVLTLSICSCEKFTGGKGSNPAFSYVAADSLGCFIRSHAHFDSGRLGADVLGERGKRAEDVGKEAAQVLKREIESGASIDHWMVDQIIPYMSLATWRTGKPSRVRIPPLTKHAETNIWVVKKFLQVDFEIAQNVMICTKAE